MNPCFPTTSKRNLQSNEPPYTACPDFYREDPTPKAFGGGVRGAPRQLKLARPSTRLWAGFNTSDVSFLNLSNLLDFHILQNIFSNQLDFHILQNIVSFWIG